MATSTGSTFGYFKKSMVGGYNFHNRRQTHSINHQTNLGTNMMRLFNVLTSTTIFIYTDESFQSHSV